MILPLLLASTLAAATPAPAPEPAAGPSPAATPATAEKPGLDEPINLNLKDADVVDVLEKFADLLGVTPIMAPGVGGRVDVVMADLSIAKGLEMVGKAAGLDITVTSKVLRARLKAGRESSGVPARPQAEKTPPAALGDVLRFRLEGSASRPADVRLPKSVGRLSLPGCVVPVTIAPLGPYGGAVFRVALASRSQSGGREMGRILGKPASAGTKLSLPGCDARLVVEMPDSARDADTIDPAPVDKGEPIVATMRLIEVTEKDEESLFEPKIAFCENAGFSVRSGFAARKPGDREQEIEVHAAPLATRGDEFGHLLAVFARITRTRAASEGGGALEAQRAESLWLREGEPTRWTVDSSWDGGRAALVLEVTLTKPARR